MPRDYFLERMMKKLRPLTIFVVAVFFISSVRLDVFADIINVERQKAEHKKLIAESYGIRRALSDMEIAARDLKSSITTGKAEKLAMIAQRRGDINDFSAKTQKSLNALGELFQIVDLPESKIQRHKEFAQKFNDRLDALHTSLDALEAASGDQERFSERAGEFEKLLKGFAPLQRRRPLDVKNLPHRKGKERARQDTASRELITPILLASAGPLRDILTGSPITPVSGPPTEDDTSETPDIIITQEIIDLAASLGNHPIAIYEYVRNNFEYQPYYGSIKGSVGALAQGSGNDIDLASLLMALLRASEISCRYVYGTIDVPVELAAKWVGVDDPELIASFFIKNNIPVELGIVGGEVSEIRMDHVWVTAYVDYIPYRGAGPNKTPDTWIDIDPCLKRTDFSIDRDIGNEIGVDPVTLLSRIKALSVVNETEFYATAVPEDFILDEIASYSGQVQDYASANSLDVESIFRASELVKENLKILPLGNQYKIESKMGAFSELPETLRYQVNIGMVDGNGGGNIFHETLDLPTIAGKRITLSYSPKTADDEAVLLANVSNEDFPAYLVDLTPRLMIDGGIVVTGPACGMGDTNELYIEYIPPFDDMDTSSHNIRAGEYHSIVLDTQSVTSQMVTNRQEILQASIDLLNAENLEAVELDDVIGEALNITGLNFFYQLDLLKSTTAGSLGVVTTREPSAVVMTYGLTVTELLGAPLTSSADHITADISRDVYVPVSRTGSTDAENQFLITQGLVASTLEHNGLEEVLSGTAVSATRMLQAANRTNTPIYTVDETNVDTVIAALQDMPSEVITDIQNAVNANLIVTIPQEPTDFADYTGTGYVIMDPDTGASAYMLQEGIAGGRASANVLNAAELIIKDSVDGYEFFIAPADEWLTIMDEYSLEVAFSYIPAAMCVNEWFEDTKSLDKVSMLASIIAISGNITGVHGTPAILNVAIEPSYISPNDDTVQDSVTITAKVTADASWQVIIYDAASVLVKSYSGTDEDIVAVWDGTDTSLVTVPDGTYTYKITAIAGSTEAIARTGTVYVDTTAPVCEISLPAQLDMISEVVAVRGTVYDTSFEEYVLEIAPSVEPETKTTIDTGTDTKLSETISVFDSSTYANDDYILTLIALDKAGNATAFDRNITIANATIDTTPPSASVDSPTQGQGVSGSITLIASATDDVAVAKIEYYIDSRLIGTSPSSPYTEEFSTSALANGAHTARAKATDTSNNSAYSTPVTFTTDNTYSRVSIAPNPFSPNNDGLEDTTTISATLPASDVWIMTISDATQVLIKTFAGTGSTISQVWDGTDKTNQIVPDADYALEITLSGSTDVYTDTISVENTNLPPVVEIGYPATGQDNPVTGFVDVFGTAYDRHLAGYTLSYQALGSGTWTQFKTATESVENAMLGTLDTSMIENGFYKIQLMAEDDQGQMEYVYTDVLVYGELKIGNFRITQQDLAIPVSGIPITVSRTYDSIWKSEFDDFGHGWRMDLSDVNIEEDEYHNVFITLPDGRRTVFVFSPTMDYMLYPEFQTASFDSVSGVHDTLTPMGDVDLLYFGGEYLTYDLQPYEPHAYELTTADGMKFVFDENTSPQLQTIEDTNGNTLTYTHAGIIHSDGKSVTFVRDAEERIEKIIAPDINGEPNEIVYTYSPAGDLVSVEDQEGNITEFVYTPDHNMDSIKDSRGITPVINEYDPESGCLIAHTDAYGERIEYTHDLENRQEVVYDRLGVPSIFEYDDAGNVVRTTDVYGYSTDFVYDNDNNLLSEINAFGDATSYTYSDKGNQLTRTDPLGNTTTSTYNDLGQVLTTTDPLGRVTSNVYSTEGNLLSTTDALGSSSSFVYDSNGRMEQSIDSLGHVSTFEYDINGYMTAQEDTLGNRTTYTYNDHGHQLTQTRTRMIEGVPETITTWNEYDNLGRLVKSFDPYNIYTQTAYNAIGKQEQSIDKLGNITKYEYGLMGNLEKVIFPDDTPGDDNDNPFESYTYDLNGRRETTTDRSGMVSRSVYDSLGRVVQSITAEGTAVETVTSTVYDRVGRVASSTDARGNTSYPEYDSAGRRVATVDALGNRTSSVYGSTGNLLKTIDANFVETTYSYNARNQKVKTTFADGTFVTTSYDELGRKVKEVDQAGLEAEYTYDDLGRLASVLQSNPDDVFGEKLETKYTYDELGNQLTQEDARERVTEFSYDKMGRRIKRTLPSGEFETVVYNIAGNVQSRTDFEGQETTFEYDEENRLVKKFFLDGITDEIPDVEITYTDAGRQYTVEDARGITVCGYDDKQRLVSVDDPVTGVVSYTYNDNSSVASVTTVNGTVSYARDELNRLETVTDRDLDVTSYTYNKVGTRATVTPPSGTVTEYTYDTLNRLTDITNGTVSSYGYTLGDAGNRTQVVEADGRVVDYTYDNLYRLTDENITDSEHGNSEIQYTYDDVGNRLAKTVLNDEGLEVVSYIYDDNDRLLNESSSSGKVTTYTYDLNGSCTQKYTEESGVPTEQVDYVYNWENRLASATTQDLVAVTSTTTNYKYDQSGIRVQQEVDGSVVDFVVDKLNPTGYAQVLEERDGTGTVLASYTYGDDLISQSRDGATHYYVYDGQMSVRQLVNAGEAVQNWYDYDAFGVDLQNAEAVVNLYKYTGEQYDNSLGWYYLRARYYNQGIGRFMSFDSFEGNISDPLSLHKYVYTGNRAVDRYDPSGHMVILLALVTIVAAMIAYFVISPRLREIPDRLDGAYVGRFAQLKAAEAVLRRYDSFYRQGQIRNLIDTGRIQIAPNLTDRGWTMLRSITWPGQSTIFVREELTNFVPLPDFEADISSVQEMVRYRRTIRLTTTILHEYEHYRLGSQSEDGTYAKEITFLQTIESQILNRHNGMDPPDNTSDAFKIFQLRDWMFLVRSGQRGE